jgi:hypothetical protein
MIEGPHDVLKIFLAETNLNIGASEKNRLQELILQYGIVVQQRVENRIKERFSHLIAERWDLP